MAANNKNLFIAKHGNEKALDGVFATGDWQAKQAALVANPCVTREHVLKSHKDPHAFVRLYAYIHPHTTDKELKNAHKKEESTNVLYAIGHEMDTRTHIRTGILRPSINDKHWGYYKQTYGKDEE
jgi:hypothetical protein